MSEATSDSWLVRLIGLLLVIAGVAAMVLGGSCAGLALTMAPAMEHGMDSDMFTIAAWAGVVAVIGFGVFKLGSYMREPAAPPTDKETLPPQ